MAILRGAKKLEVPMTAEQFHDWLKRVTDGGDGQLSKEDLREALRFLGLHCKRWKVWRAMRHADLNRNRHIDGNDEFEVLVDYARRRWGIIITECGPK